MIHQICAGPDHRTKLVPVHGFGDDCGAVPDQVGDFLDRHPGVTGMFIWLQIDDQRQR
jgi:hypothetical protein